MNSVFSLIAILVCCFVCVELPVSACVQEAEVRAREIEEAQKIAGSTTDSSGRVNVRLLVTTEDGRKPRILVLKHSGPGSYVELKGLTNEYRVKIPVGFVDSYLSAPGYMPVFVTKQKQLASGDVLDRDLMLSLGIPTPITVIDQDGHPVEGAAMRAHVYLKGKNFTSSSSFGRIASADADGLGEVNLPEDTERVSLSVWAKGYSSSKLESPAAGEPATVTLTKNPVTSGVVRDHEGKPVSGARVYHLGRSNVKSATGNITNREYKKPCAETLSDGTFSTDSLGKGSWHTLLIETENNREIFYDVQAEDSLECSLPPMKAVTFRLEGEFSAIEPERLQVAQNYHGPSGGGTVYLTLPHRYDAEEGVLSVDGLVHGSLRISAGELGDLFCCDKATELEKEVSVVVKRPKAKVKRTVEIDFESNGEKVYPRGLLGFHSRTKGIDGVTLIGMLEHRKVRDGVVRIMTTSPELSVKSDGLIGFVINDEETIKLDGEKKTLKVSPAGSIQGVVLDSNGKPVSTTVRCSYRQFPSSSEREVVSNDKGEFVLTPVPFGVKVKVWAGSFSRNSEEQWITLSEDEAHQDVELVLPEKKLANRKE